MALIRLTRWLPDENQRQENIIINTQHIVMACADIKDPPRGTWIHFAQGDSLLACMTFDEFWTFLQRET